MSGRRAVVTGGCGFLGSHLVERLLARGDEVVVFDGAPRPSPDGGTGRPPAVGPGEVWRQARYVAGDVRDLDSLARAIRPGVDVVYHLAAVVGVDRYLSRPLDVIDVNVLGTRRVLELATRVGARVVVASTSEVFGRNPAVPWPEDAERVLGPTTADRWTYSTSKALAEHLTFAFARQHGLDATVVRYFNAYGPRQRAAYVVSRAVHRALNGLPPVVYDGGRQTRCFTYVADVVRGTLLAGDAAGPGGAASGQVFNLGSMVETPIAEVVSLVAKLSGGGVVPIDVDAAERLGPAYQDLSRRVPDNTKARTVLGWTCDTTLEDGVRATIDWARANPWWLATPDEGA